MKTNKRAGKSNSDPFVLNSIEERSDMVGVLQKPFKFQQHFFFNISLAKLLKTQRKETFLLCRPLPNADLSHHNESTEWHSVLPCTHEIEN